MKKIIFITDNIFTHRDYLRFGFDVLNNFFKVEVLSTKKYKNNLKQVIFFGNFKKLKKYLKHQDAICVIDLLFPNFLSFQLKLLCKLINIKIVKLKLGPVPVFSEKTSLFERVLNNFIPKLNKGGSFFFKIKCRFFIIINSLIKYDIIFLASHLDQKKNDGIFYIKNHSLDYDFFLKKYNKVKKDKIVFVDGNILYNTDYKIHSTKRPIEPKKYIESINSFFSQVEKKINARIVVAASPKSDLKKIKKIFKNRTIVINKTFELIKDAKFVLLHKSTAVSFAVLFNKPLIFLINNELLKTWYGKEIIFQSKLLGNNLINIDKPNSVNRALSLGINNIKYKNYLNDYIKFPNSKNINNWLLFSNILNKMIKYSK